MKNFLAAFIVAFFAMTIASNVNVKVEPTYAVAQQTGCVSHINGLLICPPTSFTGNVSFASGTLLTFTVCRRYRLFSHQWSYANIGNTASRSATETRSCSPASSNQRRKQVLQEAFALQHVSWH